jgi:hypothetical protein
MNCVMPFQWHFYIEFIFTLLVPVVVMHDKHRTKTMKSNNMRKVCYTTIVCRRRERERERERNLIKIRTWGALCCHQCRDVHNWEKRNVWHVLWTRITRVLQSNASSNSNERMRHKSCVSHIIHVYVRSELSLRMMNDYLSIQWRICHHLHVDKSRRIERHTCEFLLKVHR